MQYAYKLIRTALLLLVLLLPLTGCDSNDDDTGTFVGEIENLGDGSAYAFITLDDGRPTAIGVSIDELALTDLPHTMQELTLALPTNVAAAPYDHVSLDWNPHGHDPEGVYSIPHFDVHFYMMAQAERDGIDPTDPDFAAKAEKLPEASHIPAGYIQTPGGVPRMGAHWVDPTSPEFTEAGFSRTFIYGFWNGEMNFLEPMLTKAFIESVKNMEGRAVSYELPQPQAFAEAGYYPTRYSVKYNPNRKTYLITMENLTKR